MSELHQMPVIKSQLPSGWVPEGAAVHVVLHVDDDRWEALIPEFAIAGQGQAVDDAARNAIELLDDYLVLCASEGLSYLESARPISRSFMWAVVTELLETIGLLFPVAMKARLRNELRPHRSSERYKVPLRLVGVC